jgi:hypothetical protein
MSVEGGCFCGNIRYSFEDGDYDRGNCHCTICRRISAAPFVSWIFVPADSFSYTKGTPATMEASDNGTRYYCPSCGSHLAGMAHTHTDLVHLTLCSLDEPEKYPPTFQTFVDTKLAWVTDDLPISAPDSVL